MWKNHILGIVAACSILLIGIVVNPFQAEAESLNWGFKKGSQEQQGQS